MSDVIDIAPRLLARRRKDCPHHEVVVDYEIADLECAACGSQLDPWWYLRKMAKDGIDHRETVDMDIAKAIKECNQKIDSANTTLTRLNEEIRHLTNTKNTLFNEPTASGQILGVVAGRARRRRR